MSWISDYFYNDSALLPVYGMTLAVAFLVMAAAVFFHEIGHLLYFRYKLGNKKARVIFHFKSLFNMYWEAGTKEDYKDLTDKQYKGVMTFGVLFGLFPILFASYVWFPFALLIIPYISGSWSDIKQLTKGIDIADE